MSDVMKLGGFIPVGDQDRMMSQDELDRALPFNQGAIAIFERIPDDIVMGVILSVMATWALKFDDPQGAMAFLTDQATQVMPRLMTSHTATRQ